jgi:hypothetical protein
VLWDTLFLHYADINRRINGGYMSDYEMRQEDDINEDIEIDNILDGPRHDQAYFLNKGDY